MDRAVGRRHARRIVGASFYGRIVLNVSAIWVLKWLAALCPWDHTGLAVIASIVGVAAQNWPSISGVNPTVTQGLQG